MTPLKLFKACCHGACCGAYSLIFSGAHDPMIYALAAAAYGGLTLSEFVVRKPRGQDPST